MFSNAAHGFPVFRRGEEVAIGCLPFFHSFGMTTAMNISIFYGWANALIPKPEPKAILDAIQKYKATFMPAVPTLYNGLINYPDLKKYDLTSLRGCFSGGAPLPLETIRSFEKTDRCPDLRRIRAHRIVTGHAHQSFRRQRPNPAPSASPSPTLTRSWLTWMTTTRRSPNRELPVSCVSKDRRS